MDIFAVSRTSNIATADRSQGLILAGTVVVVVLAAVWQRIAESQQFRPEGLVQFCLLSIAILTAASVGAMLGRSLFSRPTAALLGAVGGGLSASFVNPLLGALAGFGVGLLVSLSLGRLALRIALVFGCGFLGAAIARRIYIDVAGLWSWIGILVLLISAGLQLVCLVPVARRLAARERRLRRWMGLLAFGLLALLTVAISYIGGWHGEFYRRVREIEQRGGYLSLRAAIPADWLWGRSSGWVNLHDPRAEDWATLRSLATVTRLSINGDATDDESLAGMPPLPGTSDLILSNSNISGSFLSGCDLPKLTTLMVTNGPFDDEAMTHVGELTSLRTLVLHDTKVTGRGLARLWRLPSLAMLQLAGEQLGDDDLRGLAGTQVRTLVLHCPKLTADGVKHLRDVGLLADLSLKSPADDQAIRSLADLPNLVALTLYIDTVTPETGAALKKIPANVTLRVFVHHEQEAGERLLKRQLPNLSISTY